MACNTSFYNIYNKEITIIKKYVEKINNYMCYFDKTNINKFKNYFNGLNSFYEDQLKKWNFKTI